MEKQNEEMEREKIQESIRKLQQSLGQALEEGRYWGLDEKISFIQRSFRLSQRI